MHHTPHLYWTSYNSGLFRRQYYDYLCCEDWTPPLVHDRGRLEHSTPRCGLFAAIAGSAELQRVRRLTLPARGAGHASALYGIMLAR